MPELNIFFIGTPNSKVLKSIRNSKYLKKLFTNFETDNAVEVRFNTFRELAKKCKALKVDLVLVDDKKMILQGIADTLRKNFVNCIALNSFWTKLVLSNQFAKEKLEEYGICTPQIMSYPQKFPLIIRADGVKEYAKSLEEVISIRQKIVNTSAQIAQTVYLEEFINGKKFILTSLFDGKHLITFPIEGIEESLITDYNQKLEKMFVNENSNFIGYINSEIISEKQTLYNVGFNLDFPTFKEDLLFVLISAIYQKLNEIKLS